MRLPRNPTRTILLDPPWRKETGGGRIKRGAQAHYPLMSNAEILAAVTGSTQWAQVADDAHCYLWCTNNALPGGMWLMKELGFRYITTITWVKMERRGPTPADGKDRWVLGRIGLGRYFCGVTEQLLFGVRGKAMVPEPINRGKTVILASKREHSRKPDEQYEMIEKVSPGGHCEFFARGAGAPGWQVWGDEAAR